MVLAGVVHQEAAHGTRQLSDSGVVTCVGRHVAARRGRGRRRDGGLGVVGASDKDGRPLGGGKTAEERK